MKKRLGTRFFLVLAMSDISQVRASQQVGEITLDPKDAESAFVF
jgi:hypothetical protein